MNAPRSNPSLRDRIVADIVSGALPFGARVTIDSLAQRYSSSHMPVREALRELHGEGLLMMERNRGARVVTVDREFVECMFDTRGALEVMLTRRAVTRCSDAEYATLVAIEDELEQHVQDGAAASVHDANRRFHNGIYTAARNADALAVVRRYWIMNAAIWGRYGYAPERFAGMVLDHRHLLRAIRERDVEAGAVLIGAHVIKAKQELLTRMVHGEAAPPAMTLAA